MRELLRIGGIEESFSIVEVMSALDKLSVTALCLLLVTGCTSTKGDAPRRLLDALNETPIIELSFKSRMMTNQEHLRIYESGTIFDNRYGKMAIHDIGRSRARRVLQHLERVGFFGLDQNRIALKVQEADDNWHGTKARHSLVIIDPGTITLTAATQSRTNTVSVTGLSSHLREYSSIAEFEHFKRCVHVVESAVP
jgi:hypothetical protein